MDPIVLASIIGGGAMLASGGASIGANANLNKKNREWQEKMVNEQREYDELIYDKRYSPAAQSQAKAAAGLNPFSGVETMNVGTSSSVPTPATNPYDFGDIGRAGEVIASGLQSREAMKLERQKFNQAVTNDTRNYIIELTKLDLSKQELDALLESKREEIKGLKLDNKTKELNVKMLDDFINQGGNTFTDASNFTQAQTDYTNAQKDYQNLMGQIASEQNEMQKKVLEAKAESLKASATQAYANAILANAQTEVAKSTKSKLDNDVKLANNEEARKSALHLLQVAEQNLVNEGIASDNIKKHFEAEREKILNGHVESLNDVGNFILWTVRSFIPFAPTSHY